MMLSAYPTFIGFILLLAFVIWVSYEADIGAENLFFTLVDSIPFGDKLGHIWLYGGLALLLNLGLKCRSFRFVDWRIQWGSAVVLLFAILEELSQGFFAARTLDMGDILADIIGVYLAAFLISRKLPEQQP